MQIKIDTLLNETTRRLDYDLLTNQCNLDFDEQIKVQNEAKSELERITQRIENMSGQIRDFRAGDTVRVIIRQHMDEAEQQLAKDLEEQLKLIDQYLPLLKIPTNPIAAVKWVAKFVTNDLVPQMDAAIRFTTRIIRLTSAVVTLASEVQEAIRYTEDLAKNLQNELQVNRAASLERVSFNLQAQIQNKISQSICNSLELSGINENSIESLYSTLNDLTQIQNELSLTETNLNSLLEDSVNKIDQTQTAISSITGVPEYIDTSNVESYVSSIENGDAGQYFEETKEFIAAPPINNITSPSIRYEANNSVVANTVDVLTTLLVDEGEWSGRIESTEVKWFVSDELVSEELQFTPSVEHIGKSIVVTVLKQNNVSIAEANTQTIESVSNPFTFVANITSPTLTGTAQVGQTLTCSQGLWAGTSPLTYAYQWEYAKTGEQIEGADSNTYTIDQEDLNRTLRCKVTATNLLGSNSINSQSSTIIVES